MTIQSFAQTGTTVIPFVIPKSATVKMSDIQEDWRPFLQNIEAPKPDGKNSNQLQKIKDSLSRVYPKKSIKRDTSKKGLLKTTGSITAPFLGRNFQGNIYASNTPNDNDIAISNGYNMISVQNSTIFTCNASKSATTNRWLSLSAFSYVLANPHSKFDPKTIYDPINDKYVVVFLNGFTDSTSSITVAFSNSNDPNGSWSLYELPGNPFNNGLWTDYPMIAMTEHELFITVNLLYPDSSWQTGFNESLIWQVNKNSGYSGLSLNAVVHHDIMYGGRPVRNLCPVKGGSGLYGPNINFLSERNLDPQNDTVFLVQLNDTIGAPSFAINVSALIAPISYFMPPNADQPGSGTSNLATNDSRILGAFIENDKIQYVQNCMDTASGKAAVYHGIINDVSTVPYVTSHIITDTLLEFGYPNISYAGTGAADHTAIINFDHAAKTVNPGVSALVYDGIGNYSPVTTVKTGVDYLRVLGGNERWGDYSGSQRKYDEPGRVWVNGLYANNLKQNTTWIGELSLSSLAGVETSANKEPGSLSLYPNPTDDLMNVVIYLDKVDYLNFEIFDVRGSLVKVLLREKVKAGKNNFSFSTKPLSSGTYFLKVTSRTKEILAQKFERI